MVRVKIISSLCKGCSLCVEACPNECLVMEEEINLRGVHAARFDDEDGKCRGCGNCVLMCPDVAIEIIEGEDG